MQSLLKNNEDTKGKNNMYKKSSYVNKCNKMK